MGKSVGKYLAALVSFMVLMGCGNSEQASKDSRIYIDTSNRVGLEKTLEAALLTSNPSYKRFQLRNVRDPYNELNVRLYPRRHKVSWVSDSGNYEYRVYTHWGKYAPTVVLVPGVGADIKDDMANFMAQRLFDMGYHVLLVPNNLTPQFTVQVSRSGLPGVASDDARDMIRAVAWSLKKMKYYGVQSDNIHLVGFSLGAVIAAHMSQQIYSGGTAIPPSQLGNTVLLNPPLDIEQALTRVDSWCAGGTRNYFSTFLRLAPLQSMVKSFQKRALQYGYRRELMNDFIFNVNARGFDLREAIGCSLFYNFNEVVLASQTVYDRGLLGRPSSGHLLRRWRAKKIGFSDYYDLVSNTVLNSPNVAFRNQFEAENILIGAGGIGFLTDYFRANPNIYMIHNWDDVIIDNAHLRSFYEAFGQERSVIYDRGGHLGNMWEPYFLNDLQRFLSGQSQL